MTVICPVCDARYRDPPEHVALARPLQCGHCDHEWVRQTVAAPSMVPDMEDLTGEPKLPALSDGAPMMSKAPIYVDVAKDVAQNSSHGRSLLAASVALAALFGTGWFAKDAIITAAPQTAALYKAIGVDVANAGLKIANITTTRSRKDGISQLIVRGEIANAASATVPVPALLLTMRGKTDERVYQWTAKANTTQLGAGEVGTFTAVARDYPDSAIDVEVSFEPTEHKTN